MCTVTVVPDSAGFRMMCNRDERRARPAADPPRVRRFGRLKAIAPVDPSSGGTWIAVNEAGLAAVVLNRHPRRRPPAPAPASRGTLIPALAAESRLAGVIRSMRRLKPGSFEPFTLLAVQHSGFVVARNVGSRLAVHTGRLSRALLFTSSSLGDARVWLRRRRLFNRLVEYAPDRRLGQALFHGHAWPDQPEISVRMRRSDAATVSRTTVDVGYGVVRVRYEPL